MRRITLIRHGQTWRNFNRAQQNPEPEFHENIANSGLSFLGEIQAIHIKGEFDLVILSPLRRAIETYAKSKIRTSEIIISDLVHERRDGTSYNAMDNEEPYEETHEQLTYRVNETIKYIKSLGHNRICIITHGSFMECFLKKFNIDVIESEITNCSQFNVYF